LFDCTTEGGHASYKEDKGGKITGVKLNWKQHGRWKNTKRSGIQREIEDLIRKNKLKKTTKKVTIRQEEFEKCNCNSGVDTKKDGWRWSLTQRRGVIRK
jgi:hypothetical protein